MLDFFDGRVVEEDPAPYMVDCTGEEHMLRTHLRTCPSFSMMCSVYWDFFLRSKPRKGVVSRAWELEQETRCPRALGLEHWPQTKSMDARR